MEMMLRPLNGRRNRHLTICWRVLLGVSAGEWEMWRGRFLGDVREVAVDEEDGAYMSHAVDTWTERLVDAEGRLVGLEGWLEREEKAQAD